MPPVAKTSEKMKSRRGPESRMRRTSADVSFAMTSHQRRRSCDYGPCRDIPCDRRPGAHNGPLANGNSGPYEHVRRDPRFSADDDRRNDQRHCRPAIVMAGRAQVGILADGCELADGNRGDTIAIYMVGQ